MTCEVVGGIVVGRNNIKMRLLCVLIILKSSSLGSLHLKKTPRRVKPKLECNPDLRQRDKLKLQKCAHIFKNSNSPHNEVEIACSYITVPPVCVLK